MPCRINRRRLWTGRIVLESRQHEFNSFATFTYANRYHFYCKVVPRTLDPRHLQLFWKRLRKERQDKFRYFAVGEYGDQTWRPHYHAALFGISMFEGDLLSRCWGFGHVHLGELTHDSAQYIAGYVTKKMTAVDDTRLNGLHPEFARMSQGIGKSAIPGVGLELTKPGGSNAILKAGDVPREIRTDGKTYPLGRYLRGKLREEVGWQPQTPQGVRLQIAHKNSLMSAHDITVSNVKRASAAASAEARVKISGSKKTL